MLKEFMEKLSEEEKIEAEEVMRDAEHDFYVSDWSNCWGCSNCCGPCDHYYVSALKEHFRKK